MRKLSKRCSLIGFMFILPSLAGISAFFVAPFFRSLYYTFTQGITNVKFVGVQNFAGLFGSEPFTLAVRNTAVFMGVGVPVLFFAALILSLLLTRAAFVFERFALLAPLIVPVAAVVAAWRLLFAYIPAISQNTMFVVVLMFIWKNLGYIVVILTSAITVLPKEYYEVFRLDSNSFLRYSVRIIMPLIAPMAFFAIMIAIMNSFKIFREIYVMYGTDPPKSIYMLQHFMNNNFFKLNYQRLSAAAFLVMVVVFLLIWTYMRLRDKTSENL